MAFRPIHDTQQMLGSLQDEMNRMFERVWHVGVNTPPFDGQKWAPPADLYEFDDQYVLFAEVPGLSADEIEIHNVGNSLTIRGEKKLPARAANAIAQVREECRHGPFCRTIDLPEGTALDRISAKCAGGVLEVTIPKSETCRPKTIKVRGEEPSESHGGSSSVNS